METRLCRICGKLGQNFLHIFRIDGLKNKIETCLPIVVTPYSLLPDTVCGECSDNLDHFYAFLKSSLQNIIILETQYDINESCLKSKRRQDKGCSTDLRSTCVNQHQQTDDYLDILLRDNERLLRGPSLVDYDIESSISGDDVTIDDNEKAIRDNFATAFPLAASRLKQLLNGEDLMSLTQTRRSRATYWLDEIAQRKRLSLKKRAMVNEDNGGTAFRRFRVAERRRRKCRRPRKRCMLETEYPITLPGTLTSDVSYLGSLDYRSFETDMVPNVPSVSASPYSQNDLTELVKDEANILEQMDNGSTLNATQICLLCEEQFCNITALTSHVFEMHGIDMSQILSSYASSAGVGASSNGTFTLPDSDNSSLVMGLNNGTGSNLLSTSTTNVATVISDQRKRKLPTLMKIIDLKRSDSTEDVGENLVGNSTVDYFDHSTITTAPTPTAIPCNWCATSFNSRQNLFDHLRVKHTQLAGLVCGLCMYHATDGTDLKRHLTQCNLPVSHRYWCKICKFSDDNLSLVEGHAAVHDWAIVSSGTSDLIGDNWTPDTNVPSLISQLLLCTECDTKFDNAEAFSWHRRTRHSLYHCDLCDKFYGRNSHLWKHVSRVHCGNALVTCTVCGRISASKYHLEQHMSKAHGHDQPDKPLPTCKEETIAEQKLKHESCELIKTGVNGKETAKNGQRKMDEEEFNKNKSTVKRRVRIRNRNVGTNRSSSGGGGQFKCTKCLRAFHKKTLLKKHRRNCRPKLQKDLLTRCKQCARIFKDRQSLTKHLDNYHRHYLCEICQQSVESKCEIVSHIRFAHPLSHLVCRQCGNVLRSRSELLAHTSDHDKSHVCQFCGDCIESKIKLKMHILSLHRKILSLSCGVCLRLFDSQQMLRDHVRVVHRHQLTPLTSCPVCGKNYGSKWKTYDHLTKSHGAIFRACKLCLDVFNSDTELQRHMSQHHATAEGGGGGSSHLVGNETTTIYTDVVEGHSVAQVSPQQYHHTTGGGTKRTVYVNSDAPSCCEICQKTWPAKKHLWQHYIRCHKRAAATVCGICLKTNANYQQLQDHLHGTHPHLLHGQGFGSNFICRICGRYHNASSKLKLHMAIHTGFDFQIFSNSSSTSRSQVQNTALKTSRIKIGKNKSNSCSKQTNSDTVTINYESLIEQVEEFDEELEADGEADVENVDNDESSADSTSTTSSDSEESTTTTSTSTTDDEDGEDEDSEEHNENSQSTEQVEELNLGTSDAAKIPSLLKVEDSSTYSINNVISLSDSDLKSERCTYDSDVSDTRLRQLPVQRKRFSLFRELNEYETESAVGSIL